MSGDHGLGFLRGFKTDIRSDMVEHSQDASDHIAVSIVTSISQIDAEGWDACANPVAARRNPFVSHAFLSALEDAGCVGAEPGWIPRHLVLRDGMGAICAVMACYIKTHSAGEYVFDHAWADALERAGGAYYPKLQCAVPFTPVPGPRIFVRPGPDADHNERMLALGAVELTRQMGLSSLHITFVEEEQCGRLAGMGFLTRTDQQFHWHNSGYGSFDQFLETLSSRKRKAVRREREKAVGEGISVERLRGDAITNAHWDAFYEFYLDTSDKKWGNPYLNRALFERLGETMAESCLLILAKRDGRFIAGALHMIGGECLFGRYWGAGEHVDCLHFELCYYQAIEYAIKHGLKRVEAGAQGDHKLARGYSPTTTHSAHFIADTGLSDAIERYLVKERRQVERIHDRLGDFTPYKKSEPTGKDR